MMARKKVILFTDQYIWQNKTVPCSIVITLHFPQFVLRGHVLRNAHIQQAKGIKTVILIDRKPRKK